MTEPAGLQGVGRAFDVLECLADRPMTATELVDALGVKWATAHRTLSHLRERGYLERDERSGTYYLGARLYSLGSSYLATSRLVQVSRVHLRAALDQSGQTVQLAHRDGYRSVVLSVIEPQPDYVPHTSLGHNFPLNCSSKGHVLLAWADPAFVDEFLSHPLPALTPYSTTDPKQLRERLALVREQGYAVTSRDVRLFSASVSAPVRDVGGDVVACVALIFPPAELDALLPGLVDVAAKTAEAIGLSLGWRPGANGGMDGLAARRALGASP